MSESYSRVTPSGVVERSTVPFPEDRWWDNPFLHPMWSYASWGSMILEAYGFPGPRRLFKKHWTR